MKKPYKKVFFEISGNCQAKCPHCCTGNRSLREHPSRFIPENEFERAVRSLYEKGLADESSRFDLYNWGEPFLHPQLLDILQVIFDQGAKYRLSTNAGIYKQLPFRLTQNLTRLTVTIPGFSQASYDRVHGLNFDSVLKNIQAFAEDLGTSRLWITYLVHQFNLNEIREAYRFFKKIGIRMAFTVAYLNDYNLSRDYLNGSLPNNRITRMGRDLFLSYVEDLIASRPEDYVCPQFSILALDEYCNVLTCCQVNKGHPDYSLGSLFDLKAKDIYQGKLNRKVCRECQDLGMDYWIQTVPPFPFLDQLTGEGLPIAELLETLKWKIGSRIKRWSKRRA
ncbi:MAG: radical SAM protein [Deltaproteobacteria bacterium]|nr:radical SAM protein [Deltaproteobacteria bacterium]